MNLVSSDKLLEIANFQFKKNNLELAKQIIHNAINSNLARAGHYELLAKIYDANNDNVQCLKFLSIACSTGDASAEAHYYLGKEYIKLNRLEEGIKHVHIAIEIAGDFLEGLVELGVGYVRLNDSAKALIFFHRALFLDKTNTNILFNLGKVYTEELGDYENGLNFFNQVLALDPKNCDVLIAKGILLNQIKKYEESNSCYLEVININEEHSIAWHNLGQNLIVKKLYKEALLYLKKANILEPKNPLFLSNIGSCFYLHKKYKESLHYYNQAISIKLDFYEAWLGKSMCEFKENKIANAFESIDQAIKYSPNIADCWFWKGNFFAGIKKFPDAIRCYETATTFKHDHLPLLGSLFQVKMKSLNWDGIDSLFLTIKKMVGEGKYVVDPLTFQALNDDPYLNLRCSQIWSDSQFLKVTSRFINKSKQSKIRIAYISPDFRGHPVFYLTEEIYKLHDRSKFEIYGYHLNSEADENTSKISSVFDKFYFVSHFSDEELIDLIREHKIDIAIDLAGHTQGARTNIFLNRIAQVQINFIGYPGSLGSEMYDFIIGDDVITPKNSQLFYSEKILNLQRTFQPNSNRHKSNRFNSFQDLGLPEDVFVFCCFNSNYKITEAIFNRWTNILKRTNNSILWLFVSDTASKNYILNRLDLNNVSRNRVFFAEQLSYADHLSRLRFANLFLDTYPFNAGTTCSDSIWSEVPIVTVRGKSFCGKMSESILSFNSLSELITNSLDEYEELAVKLCEDKAYYQFIKTKLSTNIYNSTFFDSKKYVKDLEDALISAFSSNA